MSLPMLLQEVSVLYFEVPGQSHPPGLLQQEFQICHQVVSAYCCSDLTQVQCCPLQEENLGYQIAAVELIPLAGFQLQCFLIAVLLFLQCLVRLGNLYLWTQELAIDFVQNPSILGQRYQSTIRLSKELILLFFYLCRGWEKKNPPRGLRRGVLDEIHLRFRFLGQQQRPISQIFSWREKARSTVPQ